jgi:hypothetical protein
MPDIKPPSAAFFLLPPGVTLPEQTAEAYMLAYADGYTLNFLFAAAFPLGQSFAIIFYLFLLHLLKQILLFVQYRFFYLLRLNRFLRPASNCAYSFIFAQGGASSF